jgi:hypothetical protein
MKRLEVVWEDSRVFLGWHPASYYRAKKRRAPQMIAVGIVIADDKRGVILATSVNSVTGAAIGVVSIPRSQIVSQRRLR